MRWFNSNWRAAHVICLDFPGSPYRGFPGVDWEAPASAPAPGSARVLRVKCNSKNGMWYGSWPDGPKQDDLTVLLPRWVAGLAPLCQNLTALHLRGLEVKPLPALPLLVHVILEHCMFTPALVASLQGMAGLETLHASGEWGRELPAWDVSACTWDVSACTRLRRVHMGVRDGRGGG